MIKSNIAGVDIGLDGGISYADNHISMPIISIETSPAQYVQDLLNGKKQFYKSGSKKGQVKVKLKKAAKFRRELDLIAIQTIFNECTTVVLELPGISMGNAARSTATTNRNFGKLLAVAELCECEIVTVTAHKWKKDLGLTKDKLECVCAAEKLTDTSFRTLRGALLDGPAEALLIRHWYVNYYYYNKS